MTALNMPSTIRRADLLEAVRSLGIDPNNVHTFQYVLSCHSSVGRYQDTGEAVDVTEDCLVVEAFEPDGRGGHVRERDETGVFSKIKTTHHIRIR